MNHAMTWIAGATLATLLGLAATALAQETTGETPPEPAASPSLEVSPEVLQLRALHEQYQQRKVRHDAIQGDYDIIIEMTDSDLLSAQEKAWAWQLFLRVYPDAPEGMRQEAIEKAQFWAQHAMTIDQTERLSEGRPTLWAIYQEALANPETPEAQELRGKAQFADQLPEPFRDNPQELHEHLLELRNELTVLRALRSDSPHFEGRLQDYLRAMREVGLDLDLIQEIEEAHGQEVAQLHAVNRIDLIEKGLSPDEEKTDERRRIEISDLIPYVFGQSTSRTEPGDAVSRETSEE